MGKKSWKVRAYMEYDLEASTEEESIRRLTECVMQDLEEGKDIRGVAEVNSEKISDKGLEEDDDDAVIEGLQDDDDEEAIEKDECENGARRIIRKHSEHSVTPQIIRLIGFSSG